LKLWPHGDTPPFVPAAIVSDAYRTFHRSPNFPKANDVFLGLVQPGRRSQCLCSVLRSTGRIVHDREVDHRLPLEVEVVGCHCDVDRVARELQRSVDLTAPRKHARTHLAPGRLWPGVVRARELCAAPRMPVGLMIPACEHRDL